MGIDLQILEFKQKIIDTINGSQMPLSISSYVLREILMVIEGKLNEQIQRELQEKKDEQPTKTLEIVK